MTDSGEDFERIDASDAELEAATETEGHWMHIIKVVCIVGKIAIVVFMLALAIKMYHSKYKKCTIVPIMLFMYIICLITLIALDMTSKYIAGFFLLIYMSNYFNFLGFYKILDTLPGAPGVALRSKTLWYFRLMNALYFITLALAFLPRFGPFCTAEKLYPACMNWTACLFIINFIFHLIINCRKDYFFEKGPINVDDDGFNAVIVSQEAAAGEKLGEANASQNTSQAEGEKSHEDSKADLDWTDAERADHLSKKMFRGQMTVYLWFQAVLVVCNVAIQLWGRVFVHNSYFLGCTDGGKQWLYTTIKGELFVGAHMVLIITQAVMLE